MESMGTMLSESEVAWCMGFFNSIRNRGTMMIPPPSPLSETTVPAKMPTSVGSHLLGVSLVAVVWFWVWFSCGLAAVSLLLLALDLPKIMLPMLSSRKPRKTV